MVCFWIQVENALCPLLGWCLRMWSKEYKRGQTRRKTEESQCNLNIWKTICLFYLCKKWVFEGEQIPLSFTCVHKASGNSCNAGLPVESAAIFSKPRFVLFQWDSVYLRVSFDQGGLRRFMATDVADLQAWKIQFWHSVCQSRDLSAVDSCVYSISSESSSAFFVFTLSGNTKLMWLCRGHGCHEEAGYLYRSWQGSVL